MTTVPYVFTIEEMLDYFLDRGDYPSAEDVEIAGGRLGRNSYPALVADLNLEGLLDAAAAAVVVPSAWSDVEFPNRALDEDTWGRLFELAGYTGDGVPAARPSEPLKLWRGAVPAHRAGWSWTDLPAVAEWFAARPHNFGEGRIWTARVEPGRLLARITHQRPGESEYVVDARGLPIRAGDRAQRPS